MVAGREQFALCLWLRRFGRGANRSALPRFLLNEHRANPTDGNRRQVRLMAEDRYWVFFRSRLMNETQDIVNSCKSRNKLAISDNRMAEVIRLWNRLRNFQAPF